ncbi:MAG: phosphoglycerate kinase, partial [Nanoarchaeota archaeon]|nr:phosphoglycerate kinase [Nanoarchaeota archaeon]
VRVDINSPIINGEVAQNERITRSAKTIKELSKKGAKVIVLAHQGRKGKSDCVSLRNHKKLLEDKMNMLIKFFPEVYNPNFSKKFKSLRNGDVILLENLRFIDDELDVEKENNQIIELSKLFDYYVIDAFSVAHRDQTSVSRISGIPLIAGRAMERELLNLNKIENTKKPHIFVFGGAKPDDLIILLEKSLADGNLDKVLLTGIIGELALKIKGYPLGEAKINFLKEHGCLEMEKELKDLMKKYAKNFILPLDVALFDGKKRIEIKVGELKENKELIDNYMIQDIGIRTVNEYEDILKKAGSIYLKGPAGNFEDSNFERGSKELIRAIVNSKGFSFMGGGHTVTAAKMFNMLKKFSYVSIAGGALVHFLSGKILPGVEVLEKSYDEYKNMHVDFVVVGSNVMDIKVDVPEKLSEVEMGTKIKIKDNFKFNSGGGGVNVSITKSKLNARVGYLGKVSTESKELLLKTLKNNKIDLIETKETKMACAKSILLQTKDKDRVIFTFRGQTNSLDIKDFDIKSFNSNNYYFTSMSGKSFQTILKMARGIRRINKNALFCFNPSSYVLKSEKNIRKLIKLVDVLVFNYDEAKELTGKREVVDCLRDVYDMGPRMVVITDGSHGSYAYNGNKVYFQKSSQVIKVVDTTGAGDCFGATFFYFYAKNYGPKTSLRYAAKNAAHLITKNGTQNGNLSYEELVAKKRV